MFEDKIAELNQETMAHPIPYDKRTYTVTEIQDILGIGRTAAYAIVKKDISARFVSAVAFEFQKGVLMLGSMKAAILVKYVIAVNRTINKTPVFEYHIAKQSGLAIWYEKRRLNNEQNKYVCNGDG